MKVLALVLCVFAAVSAQFTNYGYQPVPNQQVLGQQPIYNQQPAIQYGGYRGPQHIPVIGPLGVPLETREVQDAKVAHLSQWAKETLRAQKEGIQRPVYNQQYNGNYQNAPAPVFNQYSGNNRVSAPAVVPTAIPVITANGHLADTPEVAAAKAQHFTLYSQQAAAAALAKDNSQNRYNQVPVFGFQQNFNNLRPIYRQRRSIYNVNQIPQTYHSEYRYEQHIPVLTANGVPVDTPAVQKAKAEHFLAHEVANHIQHSQKELYPQQHQHDLAIYEHHQLPHLHY